MGEPAETWSERFEREVEAVTRLLRRRPVIALLFLLAMAFYGWHQFFKPKEESKKTDSAVLLESVPAATNGVTVAPGTAAWIYVGTRIGDQWQKSQADGIEPVLTLEIAGLPVRGATYRVIRGVNLREAPLMQRLDGARPPMANSKGTIGIGSVVKVDDFTRVEVKETELRIWVWAHVTVVEAK